MKRIYRLLICLMLLVAVFALSSCDDKPQAKQLTDLSLPNLKANQMAVIIKNGDKNYTSYTVVLGESGVNAQTCEDVLEYLKDEAGLLLGWDDSGYGKFISAIGGINPNPSCEYVEVFTSNADFQGTWAGVEIREADGVTLMSAAVGVSELLVAAGDVVYFELGSF